MSAESIPVSTTASGYAADRTRPLSRRFKTAYGVGQFVESTSTTVLNFFLFFYVTTVCGLSGSLTGLALFLALAVDAVADPVVGSISDNLSTVWGRRVPPMAVSLLPIAGAMGLLFSIPARASGLTLFLYVLMLLTALRVSLSGFIIPYFGLGAELSDDYDERSSIVAFRAIFGILATLGVYVLGFHTFLGGPKGLLDRTGYAPFGWTAAALMLVGGAVATSASLRAVPRLHAATPGKARPVSRLLSEVAEVFRNPAFRLLFVGVLVFFVGQGVFLTLSLHAYKYFWGLGVGAIQAIAIGTVVGLAAGLPVAFALIGRTEKRDIVLAGITIICLFEAVPALANVLGLIPHSAALEEGVLIVASVGTGAMTTLVAIAFQSAMADAVDEHDLLFAARREGLFFASLSFANKAAIGLGALISGILLDLIGFPGAAIAAGAHVVIGPAVLRDLGLTSGPFAALITMISVAVFARYRLDRACHGSIREALGR